MQTRFYPNVVISITKEVFRPKFQSYIYIKLKIERLKLKYLKAKATPCLSFVFPSLVSRETQRQSVRDRGNPCARLGPATVSSPTPAHPSSPRQDLPQITPVVDSSSSLAASSGFPCA